MHVRAKVASAAIAALAIGGGVAISAPGASAAHKNQIQHVLLISVDGMHQSDLSWYIANHPDSTLAQLAEGGAQFTNNHTSDPSDSDPGGTALMTGGDPRATGVYYDVEYSHATDEPPFIGPNPTHATCTPGAPATGGDVIYDSPDDTLDAVPDFLHSSPSDPAYQTFPAFDENGSVFPGGNDAKPNTPGMIMNLQFFPSGPNPSLNSATFPVNPTTCQPIMPWDYLRVNTIFQVIHAAGMRTAWSDKHEVYSSFNGPGSNGQSIDDLFSPEIDSQAVEPDGTPYPTDTDWAHDDAATKQYDGYKVDAVLNELGGYDHSGQHKVGVPAILGMNFQTVSVAEKVDSPSTLTENPDGSYSEGPVELAGYYPGTTTPGPLLSSALDYVNAALTDMVQTIQADGLASSTAIIITAKHGQSPQDPLLLKRIKDGPIIANINQAWCVQQNSAMSDPASYCATALGASPPTITPLIVAGTDDDLWQSYLSVKTQAAADFVKNYLWNNSAPAVLYNNDGDNRGIEQVPHSGLAQIYAGQEAANFFGVPYSDPDYPDVFGRVQVGVVYTGGTKIAEHGGDNPADREVPLVVYGPGIGHSSSHAWVETTQVAPTILKLLGLSPGSLQAVQQEGTKVLPGIG